MDILSKNISVEQCRMVRDAQVYALALQTCTASYVDFGGVGGVIDAGTSSSIAFGINNTHATLTLKWKVLASVDGVTYFEVQAEATVNNLAAGTYILSNPPYRYYKAQIIDGSGHATATGSVITKD